MLHFQHGGHAIISHRKVLPSGECTAHMPQRPPAGC